MMPTLQDFWKIKLDSFCKATEIKKKKKTFINDHFSPSGCHEEMTVKCSGLNKTFSLSECFRRGGRRNGSAMRQPGMTKPLKSWTHNSCFYIQWPVQYCSNQPPVIDTGEAHWSPIPLCRNTGYWEILGDRVSLSLVTYLLSELTMSR